MSRAGQTVAARSAAVAMLVLAWWQARAEQAQAEQGQAETVPASFVSLSLEGACDAHNSRLWLANTHTFKTVATTVRWRAAGGKNLTEQFFPAPNTIREIGCAAEAEIIEATFVDF